MGRATGLVSGPSFGFSGLSLSKTFAAGFDRADHGVALITSTCFAFHCSDIGLHHMEQLLLITSLTVSPNKYALLVMLWPRYRARRHRILVFLAGALVGPFTESIYVTTSQDPCMCWIDLRLCAQCHVVIPLFTTAVVLITEHFSYSHRTMGWFMETCL